jgi:GTPase Era involved in 16S rRNA processing
VVPDSKILVIIAAHSLDLYLLIGETAGIKNRKKTAEVRIGFLGGSGTGKSSLINSLLKMKVLPKSHEIASTAVPVEVAYNNDDDPDHRFRAVIEGISNVEFKKEIEELFQFKELYDMGPEEGDGENDEFDDTMYQEMLTTFAKIKWIYPTLKNIDDLGKTSAATLLKEPHVVEILDSVQSVTAKTELAFAEQIKQYIESSKPKEGEKRLISLWPLVKVVRIYVRAQILKPGIVLVDLPGSQDTSASRVAVTDNYRKNLSASVVCAPAIRAASDKIAHDLLSSVERRNMQMDGLYTSESLFFTVTKIDELIDHKDYIRTHSTELRKLTQEDMENISICQEQVKKLERDLKNRAAKKVKAEVVLEKMKLAYAKLKSRVEQTFEAQTLAGHKRKHMVDITGKSIFLVNRARLKSFRI